MRGFFVVASSSGYMPAGGRICMVCYQRVGVILLFVMNTRNYFFFHPGLIGSRVQDLKVDIYLTTSMITNRFIDF